ncbi:uncharacterized protein [Clytia hemisphaerica]|uniref:uncharacterized protein n=1 Tax=Clytia hemisphaerica TaxID=252671 RepID=UPI0034D68F28
MADKVTKKISPVKTDRKTRNSSSNITKSTPKKTADTELTQQQQVNTVNNNISYEMVYKQNQELIIQNQEIIKQNQDILSRMTALELSTDRRIKEIIESLTNTKHEVTKVIESQGFLDAKYESQKADIIKMDTKIKSMDTDAIQRDLRINKLKNHVKKSEQALDHVNFALNDLEQYGRKEMMNISGVPRLNNEDTDKIVMDIANKIGVDLKIEDFGVSHRTSEKGTAPIIVKFNSRRKRNDMWNARWNLKNVKTSNIGFNVNNSIYFNESLTEYNRSIFKKAWDGLKRSKLYDRVITENGITYAWKTYNKEHKSEKLMLREEVDIDELVPKKAGQK